MHRGRGVIASSSPSAMRRRTVISETSKNPATVLIEKWLFLLAMIGLFPGLTVLWCRCAFQEQFIIWCGPEPMPDRLPCWIAPNLLIFPVTVLTSRWKGRERSVEVYITWWLAKPPVKRLKSCAVPGTANAIKTARYRHHYVVKVTTPLVAMGSV